MEVIFKDFNPNTPIKERYEYIVDYICHNFDLGFEDAFYLIKLLKHNRSSILVGTQAIADFHIFDDALHVDIDTAQGFWSAGSIDLNTAGEILKLVFEDCENFGLYIPNTNKEWGAAMF